MRHPCGFLSGPRYISGNIQRSFCNMLVSTKCVSQAQVGSKHAARARFDTELPYISGNFATNLQKATSYSTVQMLQKSSWGRGKCINHS